MNIQWQNEKELPQARRSVSLRRAKNKAPALQHEQTE